jgi:hypothetical protein
MSYRDKAIQEVRNIYPRQLDGYDNTFVEKQLPELVNMAERAICAERTCDESMSLLVRIDNPKAPWTQILANEIRAFLIAHKGNLRQPDQCAERHSAIGNPVPQSVVGLGVKENL